MAQYLEEHFGSDQKELDPAHQLDLELLLNSIYRRREDDIENELESIYLDIDFGSFDFQNKFYN